MMNRNGVDSSSQVEVSKPPPPPPPPVTPETSNSVDGIKVEVEIPPQVGTLETSHSRNEDKDKIEGEVCTLPTPLLENTENSHSRNANKVYKSGPLLLPSKGIGWTSWKKRWFILTKTSLVFFRTDPNAIPKGTEMNLTLGGIDLNNSGSVDVKEDKKMITILFPGGSDVRAFTLKADTLEELKEWKAALEEALANAPNPPKVAPVVITNDTNDLTKAPDDASSDQSKDRQPVKSLVIGQPVLLALENIDGTPSFLELALRFVEEHGVKSEGILRQAADVDDVERRIREYEQGKHEFPSDEDSHVIGDCIKYVLRELPSSPVPASCCNALLEAYRSDRNMRVSAIRNAICETFPEPNRRLLQRLLIMMQKVAAHKEQNKMSVSAVAACMAPLLLRPLLAGECDLGQNFNIGDDAALQLMQAAAAANHAQAIVIILLEEYDNLFGEGAIQPEPYSDSDESGSESEEFTEDDESYEDDCEEEEEEDGVTEEGSEHSSNVTVSEVDETEDSEEGSESYHSGSEHVDGIAIPEKPEIKLPQTSLIQHDKKEVVESLKSPGTSNVLRSATLSRSIPAKSSSMESIELPFEEGEILNLEATKTELQSRVVEEAKRNKDLQETIERRKKPLKERRLELEKEVAKLQEQLQKEMELRAKLEDELEHINNTLRKKGDDQHREHDFNYQQSSSNHHRKLRDKQKDVEPAAPSHMLKKTTSSKRDNMEHVKNRK